MKRILSLVLSALIVLGMLTGCEGELYRKGVITYEYVNFRRTADISSDSNIICRIYQGEEVDVINQGEKFTNIIYHGETGFVVNESIKIVTENVGSRVDELLATPIPGGSKYYANVFELLCCLIVGESSIESYEGQVSVTATVINREESPSFPDTIYEVIVQDKQFSCVGKDGNVYTNGKVVTFDMVSDSIVRAVKSALEGEDPTEDALRAEAKRLVAAGKLSTEEARKYYEGGALYFYNPAGCSKRALAAREDILVKSKVNPADKHIFYKLW